MTEMMLTMPQPPNWTEIRQPAAAAAIAIVQPLTLRVLSEEMRKEIWQRRRHLLRKHARLHTPTGPRPEDMVPFLEALATVNWTRQHHALPYDRIPVVLVSRGIYPPPAWLVDTKLAGEAADRLATASVHDIQNTEGDALAAVGTMFAGGAPCPDRIVPAVLTVWRRRGDMITAMAAAGVAFSVYLYASRRQCRRRCALCTAPPGRCGYSVILW